MAGTPDLPILVIFGAALSAGGAIGGGVFWLTTRLPDYIGPNIALMLSVVFALAAFTFVLMLQYYFDLLAGGDAERDSPELKEYELLRDRLSNGNLAARLYTNWLTRTLNAVDRFFGDAGYADRTLFPHAFGLQKPAPLWTAQAFERCVLLALVYPVATIFIVWAISGHVGPAEAALALKSNVPVWRRSISAFAISFASIVAFQLNHAAGWRANTIWALIVAASIIVSGFVGGVSSSIVGSAIICVAIGLDGVATIVIVVVGAAGLAIYHYGVATIVSTVVVYMAFDWLKGKIDKHLLGKNFLWLFCVFLVPICLIEAYFFVASPAWNLIGPLLLFLGLLTLINTPFDWLSLGLTRALLRRGLERQGWWPYFYSFVDAALAAFIIAALAIGMVVGVQAFDELAMLGSGKVSSAVLPLSKLFDGLAVTPSEPEFWWVYAMLLSTMIPSLVNLAIGGASLVRGVPGVPALLLKFMPATRAPTAANRAWIATVLTGQVFIGAGLGLAALAFLFWGIILYAMPKVGLSLLDIARAVAEFDLPARIGYLAAALL